MSARLLFRISGVRVLMDSKTGVIYYKSNMTMDDDGDPFCYGPNNKGRDRLANAGHPGNWWGLLTDSKGKPILQKVGDPAPGYYISTTSLVDPKKKLTDTSRYANAWNLPYVSLPPQLFDFVHLGDLGTAIYNGKQSHFIVADSGGKGHIGEASPALAGNLGIDKNPKDGGLDSKEIGYILYPKSGTGMLLSNSELENRANTLLSVRGIKPDQFFILGTPLKTTKTTKKVIIRR